MAWWQHLLAIWLLMSLGMLASLLASPQAAQLEITDGEADQAPT